MTEINGSVLLDFKRYLKDSFGDSSIEELTDEVGDKAKHVLLSPILVGKWYPLDAWHDILSVFGRMYGKDAIVKMSRDMADRQLHGIFGLIVKFVSVERMIKAAYNKFGTFYTDGTIDIDMKDDKNVTIQISGIRQTDEHSTQLQHYLKRLAEIGTRKDVNCQKLKISELKYDYVLQVVN